MAFGTGATIYEVSTERGGAGGVKLNLWTDRKGYLNGLGVIYGKPLDAGWNIVASYPRVTVSSGISSHCEEDRYEHSRKKEQP